MDTDKKTLPLKAAYDFGASHGLEKEVADIRDMVIEWDRASSSLRRGFIIQTFERKGVFDDFKAAHWPYGNTLRGETKRRWYLGIKSQYEDFLSGRSPELETGPGEETDEGSQEFAAESDLRDFLAENPGCIERGFSLYQTGDRSGVEFAVENGFIDILGVDRNRKYVVVELKVGRGRNKTIGQLLYYMGWVDKNLGNGPCRGMIIAKEIPDDLILAVKRVPGVSLCRYSLSVSVEPVAADA